MKSAASSVLASGLCPFSHSPFSCCSTSLAAIVLQYRDVCGRNRRGHGLDIRVHIGEFLIAHHLCTKWRHAARCGISNIRCEPCQCEFCLCQTGAGHSALSNGPMALVAPVSHE